MCIFKKHLQDKFQAHKHVHFAKPLRTLNMHMFRMFLVSSMFNDRNIRSNHLKYAKALLLINNDV